MKFGTCYFVSERAAINYYIPYYGDDIVWATQGVKTKLKEKSIFIGEPEIKKNQKLSIDDGRYFVEEIK